jgi:hypothetical protein
MAKKRATRKKRSTVENNGVERGVKSRAVRAYLKKKPSAKGKEVVEALAAQGISITPNYVSVIKSKRVAKGRKSAAGGDSSKGQLNAALRLAAACQWDFASAREYLDMVQQVHQSLQ